MSTRLYKLTSRTRPGSPSQVPASPAALKAPPAPRPSRVDSGIYLDGHRVSSPKTLPETFRELNNYPGSMAWIGLVRPEASELALGPSHGRSQPRPTPDLQEARLDLSGCPDCEGHR